MPFVNEAIDTPERVAEFDALKLISPITRQPAERWRWAVDRTRGYRLVSLGGGFGEIPKIFALVVPGGIVQIEGRRDATGRPADRSIRVSWQITAVRIPRSLAAEAAQLMAVVEEALQTYGSNFNTDPVQSVRIAMPAPTFV